MQCLVLSHAHQRIAARIAEECAIYDYRRGQKVSPPAWLRDVMTNVSDEQILEGERWRTKRLEVEGRVRKLEEESIFSGKEEDLGSLKKCGR